MTILDGRKITKTIEEKLAAIVQRENVHPSLAIFYVGSHPAIEQFIRMKVKFGEAVGAPVSVYHFPETEDEKTILHTIEHARDKHDGMIVQLPVPPKFSTLIFTEAIPSQKDVDVLRAETFTAFTENKTSFLPGVVGAIDELAKAYNISFQNKKVAIVGKGRLVGMPVLQWLKREGVEAKSLDRESDLTHELKEADIIISGVGVPHIIKKEMVKDGVVIFDAGTSEEGGVTSGDVDPGVNEIASFVSPVPGGVGPLTVATLFVNVFKAKGIYESNTL
jgi:methylenetetrahydrofolate dehydrogenase (NADP+)/methenyltetrahydrofolate cyclohydrolase